MVNLFEKARTTVVADVSANSRMCPCWSYLPDWENPTLPDSYTEIEMGFRDALVLITSKWTVLSMWVNSASDVNIPTTYYQLRLPQKVIVEVVRQDHDFNAKSLKQMNEVIPRTAEPKIRDLWVRTSSLVLPPQHTWGC
jgi:hypothetical protein